MKEVYRAEDYYDDLDEIKGTEFFYSGIKDFDSLTGFPKERLSIVYGPEGVGKSTLMYNVIKTSAKDHRVLYIDSEAGLNAERLLSLQVSPKNLRIKRSIMIEDAYDAIMAGLAEFDLIIVDSVSAFSFRAELEGEAADANMGVKAKILNKLCRLLPVLMAQQHCTIILVNQERDRFDGMGKTVPGGKGQLYASSHTLRLSTDVKSRFQKGGEIAGHWVTAEIRKSRVQSPFKKGKFAVNYSEGIE